MSKLNCPNDNHDWTYSEDLRRRICENCDAWEMLEATPAISDRHLQAKQPKSETVGETPPHLKDMTAP